MSNIVLNVLWSDTNIAQIFGTNHLMALTGQPELHTAQKKNTHADRTAVRGCQTDNDRPVSGVLVPIVPEGFDFEQSVVAERTPPAEVEVEERGVILIVDIAVALGQRGDHSVRGSGNSRADTTVSLDEFDADYTLVHLVASDIGKQGVFGIGAGIKHIASDFGFGIESELR